MAVQKEKSKEKKASLFEEARRDAEKKERELRLLEHKEDADQRIAEQCDKYLDASEKYGLDNPLTQMLGTLLDVVLPLQELANQMVTMSEMMNTLGSTLDLIDLSIDNIFNVFDEGTKYGVFDRLKSARKIRVFRGNLKRRMKKILQSVQGMRGLSETLKKALAGLAGKNAKLLKKAAANKAKKGAAPKKENLSGLALEIVNARRKERGEAVTENRSADGASGVGGTGADGAPSGAPGVDGILPE